jgi:hypothetical protein
MVFDGGAPSEAHQLQVSRVQWDFVAWVMVLPLSHVTPCICHAYRLSRSSYLAQG